MRIASILAVFVLLPLCAHECQADAPTDNPTAKYKLKWTEEIRWNQVVDISKIPGKSWDERLAKAQSKLPDGGVIYFPAGEYKFQDSIQLGNGIVLRGETPKVNEARNDKFSPPTRLEFPRYQPKLNGNGTPIDSAFNGIYVQHPEADSNCGLVNVSINRGHIRFAETPEHKCGKNRLVVGCLLRNAAVADPSVPNRKIGQHAWQRHTSRHHAAVHVKSAENALIANNRLPKSGDDNFLQKNYVIKGRKGKSFTVKEGVLFDYDNRPGLYINDFGIGPGGGNGTAGTPKSHPWGFRKGVEIRDNFIYCSGRCAIAFSGDGVICANNTIRFPQGIQRWTTTGQNSCSGSSTNDNRAVQMRGYHWKVNHNDYVVHSNIAMPSKYRINDGEGLMHEAHVNSAIKDSELIGNKGNAYISLYRVHGIDGLIIRDNHIQSKGQIQAIFALSGFFEKKFPCRDVTIENNITENSGILIEGTPSSNNVVRNNRHVGKGGVILNLANAKVSGNKGYEVKTKRK